MRALMGEDFWPYGVESNRKVLDYFLESLHGITWEETRIFWKVANHIAKNLAEMAGDDLVLD
jgi:hypothetical protein